MSTTPDPPRPRLATRSADEVNEDIRALWARAGGRLSTEQRREYQCLVLEWSAARQHPPVREPRPAPGATSGTATGRGTHAA
ncbi:hypothetical protein JNUCC64_31725 [Streptomyces sp. JNUCC 64]